MVAQVKESMVKVVGADHIKAPESSMGAEDVSFVFEKTKGCYFWVGSGFEGCAPLHNSRFDFDESVLLLGVETFVRVSLDMLG